MNINPWNILGSVFGWLLLCLTIGIAVLVVYSIAKVAYTNFIKYKQNTKPSKKENQNLVRASIVDVISSAHAHFRSLPKPQNSTDSRKNREFFLKGVDWVLSNYDLYPHPNFGEDLEND